MSEQRRLEGERKAKSCRDNQTLQSSFVFIPRVTGSSGRGLGWGKGTCIATLQAACRLDWKRANMVWPFGIAPQPSRQE